MAWAGGFYVPEIGTRALGMAGAMTADAGSPAAVFHNPAGLSGVHGTQIELSAALIFPEISHFRRPSPDPGTGAESRWDGIKNSNRLGAVPFAGAAVDLGVPDLSFGLAVFVPFGASVNYPAAGAQRFVVTDIALRTIYAGPALAYRVTPRLSLGVSVSYVYADFHLRQSNALQFVTGDPEATPNPDPGVEGTTNLEARDRFSLGLGGGIQYGLPEDAFTVGISALLPTTLDLRGDAVVANPSIAAVNQDAQDAGRPALPAGRRGDGFATRLALPLILRAGMVVRPSDQVSLALDVNWQRWSTTQKLVIDFDNEYPLLLTPGATLSDVVMDNRWRDTLTVRLGAEVTPDAHPAAGAAGRGALRPEPDRRSPLRSVDPRLGQAGPVGGRLLHLWHRSGGGAARARGGRLSATAVRRARHQAIRPRGSRDRARLSGQ